LLVRGRACAGYGCRSTHEVTASAHPSHQQDEGLILLISNTIRIRIVTVSDRHRASRSALVDHDRGGGLN
jgi:hypothetical protein